MDNPLTWAIVLCLKMRETTFELEKPKEKETSVKLNAKAGIAKADQREQALLKSFYEQSFFQQSILILYPSKHFFVGTY